MIALGLCSAIETKTKWRSCARVILVFRGFGPAFVENAFLVNQSGDETGAFISAENVGAIRKSILRRNDGLFVGLHCLVPEEKLVTLSQVVHLNSLHLEKLAGDLCGSGDIGNKHSVLTVYRPHLILVIKRCLFIDSHSQRHSQFINHRNHPAQPAPAIEVRVDLDSINHGESLNFRTIFTVLQTICPITDIVNAIPVNDGIGGEADQVAEIENAEG